MRPLLEDPQAGEWAGPDGALTMRFAGPKNNGKPLKQHWAYRTERFRYINYNNGKEELYDHHNDPNEWTNLASKPEYKALKAQYKEAIFSQLPSKAESARIAQSLQAKQANTWKASYLKKHPEADANRDGVLSWPELNAHQKSK